MTDNTVWAEVFQWMITHFLVHDINQQNLMINLNLQFSYMIDTLFSDSSSLLYLTSRIPTAKGINSPNFRSRIGSQHFLSNFCNRLTSPNTSLLNALPSTSPLPKAVILLTLMGLSENIDGIPDGGGQRDSLVYALQGLEFQFPADTSTHWTISTDLLRLTLRSRSITVLFNLLNTISDSPSQFTSVISPHVSTLIPSLLQV